MVLLKGIVHLNPSSIPSVTCIDPIHVLHCSPSTVLQAEVRTRQTRVMNQTEYVFYLILCPINWKEKSFLGYWYEEIVWLIGRTHDEFTNMVQTFSFVSFPAFFSNSDASRWYALKSYAFIRNCFGFWESSLIKIAPSFEFMCNDFPCLQQGQVSVMTSGVWNFLILE